MFSSSPLKHRWYENMTRHDDTVIYDSAPRRVSFTAEWRKKKPFLLLLSDDIPRYPISDDPKQIYINYLLGSIYETSPTDQKNVDNVRPMNKSANSIAAEESAVAFQEILQAISKKKNEPVHSTILLLLDMIMWRYSTFLSLCLRNITRSEDVFEKYLFRNGVNCSQPVLRVAVVVVVVVSCNAVRIITLVLQFPSSCDNFHSLWQHRYSLEDSVPRHWCTDDMVHRTK